MTAKKKKNKESGQAIIEFLLVSTIIFTLLFLFVQMAWGIAYGHYAHYATYMASRALYSAGPTKSDQVDRAKSVLGSMLKSGGKDILPFLAKAREGDERDASGTEVVPGAMVGTHPEAVGKERSRLYSWAEGVQYNFTVNLFLLPLSSVVAKSGIGESISGGTAGEPTKSIEFKGGIPFTSDSFLGREDSVEECWIQMERLSTGTGISRDDGLQFLEDNGC